MSEQKSHHERTEPLLPWYVNGTLGPDEHKLVERHAAGCHECRDNIALLARVRNAVGDARPTPMVPQPKPDALAQALEAREARRGPHRVAWAAWAAAAGFAALVLVSAVFLLVRGQAPQQPVMFETAMSAAHSPPMDYVLSIRFERGAAPADRERVLEDMGAQHISPTADPSEYRVVVALPAESLEDLERYTNGLEALPEVRAVKAVALQLPVRRSR